MDSQGSTPSVMHLHWYARPTKQTYCSQDIYCSHYASFAMSALAEMPNDVFEILADLTRRRLVEALRNGERSVGELVDKVDIGQPGVSRQLAILQDAGFVSVRPEGRHRFYALRPEPFLQLEEWVRSYRQVMQESFRRLDAHLERMKKEVK